MDYHLAHQTIMALFISYSIYQTRARMLEFHLTASSDHANGRMFH